MNHDFFGNIFLLIFFCGFLVANFSFATSVFKLDAEHKKESEIEFVSLKIPSMMIEFNISSNYPHIAEVITEPILDLSESQMQTLLDNIPGINRIKLCNEGTVIRIEKSDSHSWEEIRTNVLGYLFFILHEKYLPKIQR